MFSLLLLLLFSLLMGLWVALAVLAVSLRQIINISSCICRISSINGIRNSVDTGTIRNTDNTNNYY